MGQQMMFANSVHVTQRKTHGVKMREYRLSDPRLMALGFGYRAFGSHYHLYKRDDSGDWRHIYQASTLEAIINKAQVL